MAAEAKITLRADLSGLGIDSNLFIKFTHSGTPTDTVGPIYTVVGNSAMNLDLGGIGDTELLGVLIIARSDTIGILINDDGTGSPNTSTGNIVINGDNNEAVYLNLAGLTSSQYIRLLGDAATAAIEYIAWGSS